MKRRLTFATAVGLALTGLVALTALADQGADTGKAASAATSTFHVTGMTCGGCEVGVRRVVKKLEGVQEVAASHKEGTATVTYQTDSVTPGDIISAIEELGYTAELVTGDDEGR